MPIFAELTAGDPAPWFAQRSFANDRYVFDTAAGRYIVLCFFGTAADRHSQAAIEAVRSRPGFFDDVTACFFGVSLDPADESERRVTNHYPGYRYFWDFDRTVSRLYGALPAERDEQGARVRRQWVILDPTLRVLQVIPFAEDRRDIAAVLSYLDALPPVARFCGFELQAPIIVLPNVFEPAFCRMLVSLYETHGGEDSGFMRERNGQTVGVLDHRHKRRRDYRIDDPEVIKEIQARFIRRVNPMIDRAHQFKPTRMERYIIGCYAAEDEAHFRPHRDNTTKGTAHRRFAVTVNLNEDFAGGELNFPEYGPRTFKPPVGAALVFSCSLLHAVETVTRGRRYAFLPFLYDDEAARLRRANARFLAVDEAGQGSRLR
jgi:peroxiredoxin/predicted 2-oxoglutarate/Fe(II)-dependent dioxygenase YbiX